MQFFRGDVLRSPCGCGGSRNVIIFVLGRDTVMNDCRLINIGNIVWRNDSMSGMIFQKLIVNHIHMLTDASVFSGCLKMIGFDYSWNIIWLIF